MRDFKFFQKAPVLFHLNMMDNPLGRIPSRPIIIDQDDYTRSNTFEGTVGELFDRYPGVTIKIVTIVIQRTSGSIEVNYNNVDGVNQRGLIFRREDKVIIRYKPNEAV